jgi:hypothetical protein
MCIRDSFMDDHIEPETGDDMYFRFLKFSEVESNETVDDDDTDDDVSDDDDTSDGNDDEKNTPGFGYFLVILSVIVASVIISRRKN